MRAMNEAGEGRWWISRNPGTIGVFPFPGSHRELVVIAPQSIFNSSLCIIALKKKSAENLKLPLLPCWDEQLLSLKGAGISWQENFQPQDSKGGESQNLLPSKAEHEPLLRCSLWATAISDSKSPQVLQHLLFHRFPRQAIPVSRF